MGDTKSQEPNGDMPIWFRVAYRYGFPAIVAAGLIWFLAGHVDAEIHEIRDGLRAHQSETRFYLRGICLNTAKTEIERANCVEH